MNFRRNLIFWAAIWSIVFLVSGPETIAQSTLRVLPLGNSITRGSMCLNGDIYDCDHLPDEEAIGYRHRLYNLLSDAFYNIDFVGKNKFGYGIMADWDNAGYDGIRDNQLADIMQTGTSSYSGRETPGPYMNSFPADIVLLHIGTNDVLADDYHSVNSVAEILDAIDDYETSSGNPVIVFLAKIISTKNKSCGNDSRVVEYNSRLVSMAQNRIISGDMIVIVDMECGAGLNYYSDLIDDVHPNQTGYDKMADKWFNAINSINNAPVVIQIPDQAVDRGSPFTQISLDSYVTDAEDNPQDITWSYFPSAPQHLNVTISEGRVATITPTDPYWSGNESIEFVAMDRGKVIAALRKTGSCITTFTINWIPEIIGQQPLSIYDITPLEITLGDLVLVEPEKAPPGLELIVEEGDNYTVDGTSITAAQNYSGQLTVPVRVIDDGKQSNTFNLTVDVFQVNFPPVITSSPVVETITNDEYRYAVIANDPDPNDILVYSASEKPGWLQINASTGVVTGYPTTNDTGDFNVTLTVSDGQYEDNQSYTLHVFYANHPPDIISHPNDSVAVSETYTYGIQATDREGNPMFYFASSLPDWLEFYPQSQVLIGVPGNEDAGNNLVTLGVSDYIDTTYQSFNIFVHSVTSAAYLEADQIFRIYPNPASNYVIISLLDNNQYQDDIAFQLFDMTGRNILHTSLREPVNEIRLRDKDIGDGIYIYRLIDSSSQELIRSGKILVRTAE